MPESRADMLLLNVGVLNLTHMLGTALGVWLWQYQAIGLNMLAAAGLTLAALTMLQSVRGADALSR